MSEPLIIKVDHDLSNDDYAGIEEGLKGLKNVIILPNWMEVVQRDLGYRIFTKEAYKEHRLSNMKACNISKESIKHIEECWDNISKGHNFIIGVGKNDLMFYSVEYFDKEVLGNGTA